MPDFCKALRQDMLSKKQDEVLTLDGFEIRSFVFAIQVSKSDMGVGELDDTMIGDTNFVSIPGQILEHLLGTCKSRLGINHPI